MSTATFTNEGSFWAPVKIVVTEEGVLNLFNSTTAQRLFSKDPLPAGTVLDSSTKTIKNGDDDLSSSMATGFEWFDLQPGPNTIVNTGTTVTMQYAATYL